MRLDDDQLATLADLIAARLSQAPAGRLVDAATLAAHLGVDRSFVYAHGGELGARRLGGPGGRLRFDLDQALAAYAQREEPESAAPRRRQRRRPSENVGSILKMRV